MAQRLYRSNNQKVIGGVCGGIAEYFDIDPVLIRALFLILIFGAGASLLIYIIGWIIIPQSPYITTAEYNAGYKQATSSEFGNENVGSDNFDDGNVNYESNYKEGSENKENKSHDSGNMKRYFAFTLIVIGILILFEEYMPEFSFEWVFPALLIGTGALILIKSRGMGES